MSSSKCTSLVDFSLKFKGRHMHNNLPLLTCLSNIQFVYMMVMLLAISRNLHTSFKPANFDSTEKNIQDRH